MSDLALIWAAAENGVIGRNNRLPWRLPKDMQFFMVTTMSKPVIMGRQTFESMKAPLPGRTNIVVTRDESYVCAGVRVVNGISAAIEAAEQQCLIDDRDEIMVAGGAAIYEACLPLATRLYYTQVRAKPEGDTFFPAVDWSVWTPVWQQPYLADAAHSYDFTISMFERG